MKDKTTDPVALFLRGILALGRRVRSERPPGSLSLSGLGILGTLRRLGPLVATRLAAEERLQPQSLTRILGDLERQALISRERNERDLRAIIIDITTTGRAALAGEMAMRRAWLESALESALTAEERSAIFAASPVMLKLAAFEPFTP